MLRDWQPARDARHAMDIYGDHRVIDWIDDGSQDQSLRQVEGRLHRYMNTAKLTGRRTESWAVEQTDISRVIGHIMLTEMLEIEESSALYVSTDNSVAISANELAEVPTDYIEMSWHFRPASWGFGYATEAAFCIAQYGFDTLALPWLLAVIDPRNKRAIAVAERLGMSYDGITTRDYGGRELSLYRLTAQSLAAAQSYWLAES